MACANGKFFAVFVSIFAPASERDHTAFEAVARHSPEPYKGDRKLRAENVLSNHNHMCENLKFSPYKR